MNFRIKDFIQQKRTLFTLTVGFGCSVETFREMKRSYRVACEMADNRFVLGYGQIIDDEMVRSRLLASCQIASTLEDALLEAIRMGRMDDFASSMDSLVEALSGCEYNCAGLLLMQIVLSCIRAMNDIVGGSPELISIQEYSAEFDQLEVIGQAKTWCLALFARYQQAVYELNLQKNNGKLQKIVQEADEHIKTNVADVNLTIDTLAARFGYTSNYFARIFRDIKGVSINEYIRKTRIDRAKQLLSETSLAVNDVAEMVGYMNKNYFFFSFKKETGLTPLSYRSAK